MTRTRWTRRCGAEGDAAPRSRTPRTLIRAAPKRFRRLLSPPERISDQKHHEPSACALRRWRSCARALVTLLREHLGETCRERHGQHGRACAYRRRRHVYGGQLGGASRERRKLAEVAAIRRHDRVGRAVVLAALRRDDLAHHRAEEVRGAAAKSPDDQGQTEQDRQNAAQDAARSASALAGGAHRRHESSVYVRSEQPRRIRGPDSPVSHSRAHGSATEALIVPPPRSDPRLDLRLCGLIRVRRILRHRAAQTDHTSGDDGPTLPGVMDVAPRRPFRPRIHAARMVDARE